MDGAAGSVVLYAAIGLAVLVVVLALRFAAVRLRRRWFKRTVLLFFTRYLPKEGGWDSIAIDSDWVALVLCGYEVETRIKKLPPEEEARVSRVSEEIRIVGDQLVAAGLLRKFAVTFPNQAKNQIINNPPTLFMLTAAGRAEIVRLSKAS